MWHSLIAKGATAVVTGAAGVAAFELLKKGAARVPWRATAVGATAVGLRGVRAAEESAERARLSVADVVAEARERIGEEVRPPAAGSGHDHEH